MSTQRTLIALDWLMPVLQDEFDLIERTLQSRQFFEAAHDASIDWPVITQALHQMAGALTLTNQPALALLATKLEEVAIAVSEEAIQPASAYAILQGSRLLRYEIGQLQRKQQRHNAWLLARIDYLNTLLSNPQLTDHERQRLLLSDTTGNTITMTANGDLSGETGLPLFDALVLPPHSDAQTYQPDELTKLWRYHSLQLFKQRQNDADSLMGLTDIADFLACQSLSLAKRQLWQLTSLWLNSQALNETPKPEDYATLLGQLEETLMAEDDTTLTVSLAQLAVDVLLQLAALSQQSEPAKSLLITMDLAHESVKASLFSQILADLEQAIFRVQQPSQLLSLLTKVQASLSNRGWVFYEQQLAQVITDAQMMVEDTSLADSMGWQVERQLQDLYSQLLQTAKTLENQIGLSRFAYAADPEQEALRFTRIALEQVKHAFNQYVQTHQLSALDVNEQLVEMVQVFGSLGLAESQTLMEQLRLLIARLHEHNIEVLSWEATDAIAEMIARFELFLDHLSYQHIDETLLTQTQTQLNRANELLSDLIDQPLAHTDVVAPQKLYGADTLVYDDEGERQIANDVMEDDASDETTDDSTAPVAVPTDSIDSEAVSHQTVAAPVLLSDAYLAAQASLKADDYGFADADIQEIFSEEAEEVFAELDNQLPVWQADHQDMIALKEIRRGFHTLKGSGRMVGALQFGETAWAVENLLNRVLDGTLPVTDELIGFIIHTRQQLPTLLADFNQQQAPSIDPAIIVLQAQNLLAKQPLNQGVPSAVAPSVQDSVTTPVENDVMAPESDELDLITSSSAPVASETTVVPSAMADVHLSQQALPGVIQQAYDALPSVADQVLDADVQEIYVEEAQEVMDTITPLYQAWQNKTDDKQALKEIRRGFHTLKGSGRIVGANQLGELAWAMENLLNQVLDHNLAISDSIVRLIGDVISAFPDLIQYFADNRQNYPDTIKQWQAFANVYAKQQGDAVSYPLGSYPLSDMPHADSEPSMVAPATVETEGTTHPRDEVFIEEAEEILASISKFISQAYLEAPVDISDDLVRAFHTLRGGAALSEFQRIQVVSATLEDSLAELMREEIALVDVQLDILTHAKDLLQQYLQDYQTQGIVQLQPEDNAQIAEIEQQLLSVLDTERTPHIVTVRELLALDIDALLDSEQTLSEITSFDEQEVIAYATVREQQAEKLANASMSMSYLVLPEALQTAYTRLMQYPSFAKDGQIISLLIKLHEQLINLFDTIAAGLQVRLDNHPIDQLLQLLAERKYLTDMATIDYEAIDVDVELLEIFIAESMLQRTRVRQSLNQWQNNLTNLEATRELQRYFVNLTGGAALVGIRSMAELAKRGSLLYQAISEQKIASDPEIAQIMQRLHETVTAQFQQIRQHHRSFFADKFVEQLDGILRQELSTHDLVPDVPLIVEGDLDEIGINNELEGADTLESNRHDPMYVQEIINNFEQRRLETWLGHEPDPDILNVFLEEAKELVDSSSQHLQAFRSNTNDIAALQALQRELHTIKGGARMVGTESVATLAHEMETIYEELGSRRKPATRMVGNLLAACHDWLANALIVLESVYNPKEPTALIRALQDFSKNPDSLKEVPVVSLAPQLEQIDIYRSSLDAEEQKTRDLSVMPQMLGNFEQEQEQTNLNAEMLRISASLMERMINLSGESAINRARIEMGISSLSHSLEEMEATVQRLADQLRRMETELEIQILAQIGDEHDDEGEFDPLEMDQYSALNQLSKSLSESASDLLDIKSTMLERTRDTENLLLQLSRTQTELQESLMDSRTVPFSRITPRLQRIARQTSMELGKTVELRIINDDGEIDRNILERITSPLEHMLRNAIDHGIERTQERLELNKPRSGMITLEVVREGGEIVIHLSDDGRGINVDAVRNKAIEQKLIAANDTSLKPLDIMQYIFNAGLSTAKSVSQISGRGVGMDVVQSEVKQLGGTVLVDSERGKGSRFTMRLPLTVAVSDALVVRAADKHFAIPLVQIERVVRVNAETIYQFHASDAPTLEIEGEDYRLRYLNQILYASDPLDSVRQQSMSVPVIIVRSESGQRTALQVDALAGSRIEVVVKPLGRQLSHIAGISAATIMGDGSVMLILDLIALMRNVSAVVKVEQRKKSLPSQPASRKQVVLIVDDSVTVRKVTSRLLERSGYETYVATDGIDALEKLQEMTPDLMLLDIEMPRMDGFELANQIRHTKRLEKLPIIMITSRTGEKHRERAMSIGVNAYMGKPFQEQALLTNIARLVHQQAPQT